IPSTGPTRLKTASRTRSPVGRVSRPLGAKIRAPLREPAMILIEALRRVEKRTVVVRELGCPVLRLRDQLAVARQAGEPQIREPGLPRAEELTLAAQLEVDLGEPEAVRGANERLEPPLSLVRELFL